MNGNYYDWIVSSSRPQGYPTAIHVDYEFPALNADTLQGLVSRELFATPKPAGASQTSSRPERSGAQSPVAEVKNGVMVSAPGQFTTFDYSTPLPEFTISLSPCIYQGAYGGIILKTNELVFGLDEQSLKPYVKKGTQQWNSTNLLGTSDVWQTQSRGTGGVWYTPTKLNFFNLTLSYAGGWLTVYRNGLIDQKIELTDLSLSMLQIGGFTGWIEDVRVYSRALLQEEVKKLSTVSNSYSLNPVLLTDIELNQLNVPAQVTTDIILPAKSASGSAISWTSSNTTVLPVSGLVNFPSEPTLVKLTATLNAVSKEFTVTVLPRDIRATLLVDYGLETSDEFTEGTQRMVRDASGNERHAGLMGNARINGVLDLTSNTAAAFTSNGYVVAPSGIHGSLRRSTFMMKVKASA
jgi:hypothetical protein